MNKKINKILALLLCGAVCIGSGCGGKNQSKNTAENTVALDYGTGIDETGNYNTALYSYNQMDTVGADPGVIWVSEEQDPVYGGYYYAYVTGGANNHFGWSMKPDDKYDDNVETCAVQCFRSKDLSTWETAGSEMGSYGFCLVGYYDDWEGWSLNTPWAPEVLYNASEGLYYMYYNIYAKSRKTGEIKDMTGIDRDRHYIGIATSETPVGPFYALSATDEATGEKVPYINFSKHFGWEYNYGVIDVDPFLDDDGSLYLYFKSEPDSSPNKMAVCLFGMKMNSWTEPDYESIVMLARPNYDTLKSSKGATALSGEGLDMSGSQTYDDGGLLEAPFMIKRNGTYYLTYSVNGYTDPGYSVWQATSNSPLGQFRKVSKDVGNPIISGSGLSYVKGTGHHAFVSNGTDLYAVYHVHTTVSGLGWARWMFADKAQFVKTKTGETVIWVNGPSKSMKALDESMGGYKNLAKDAKVSVTNGSGAEYLTDGIMPYYNYNADYVFSTNETVTIKLSFDKPVAVRSIMIHNSVNTEQAFSKISEILFEFAETPAGEDEKYKFGIIQNLAFPSIYLDKNDEAFMISCAPAIAEFNEIKVKSIEITVDANDRLMEYTKLGEKNTQLNLTEIVVLGR